MTDASTLPVSSVYHEWRELDTSIDTQVPALFSEEQLECYLATLETLLAALGLDAERPRSGACSLRVMNPGSGLSVDLDLHEDRSVEWGLEGSGETTENTPVVQVAALVARLLAAPTEAEIPQRAHG